MTLDTMEGLLQALRRLRVETGGMACLGCGHEHNCGVHGCAIIRKAMERLSGMTRADHSASTDKMVPLTLEQLREMDGQPVWIVEQPDWGHWELSEGAGDYFSDRDPGLYGLTYPNPERKGGIHKLGWIAYAYPPPHIDREAWVSVEEKLPDAEEEVRLLCVTSWGRHYQCQGFYVPPGTYRDDSGYFWDWECCEEYDEERDDYLVNPGWYESIHNWDEYSACGIADKVTNWMPLPEEPEDMEKKARGIKKDGT